MKKVILFIFAFFALICSCEKYSEGDSGIYIGKNCVIRLRSAFCREDQLLGINSSMTYEFFSNQYADYSVIPQEDSASVSIVNSVEMTNNEIDESLSISLYGLPDYDDVSVVLENGVYTNNDERIAEVDFKLYERQGENYSINIFLLTTDGIDITVRYKGPIELSGFK